MQHEDVPSAEPEQPRRIGKFRRQIKENPVITTAVAVMTLLAGVNVTTVAQNMKYFGSLATEDYVGGMLAVERRTASDELAEHAAQEDKRSASIEKGMNRIRAFTEIVPQLKQLLTLRCMGTRGLDDVIARLEEDYRNLTGETFAEQSCERLLAVR